MVRWYSILVSSCLISLIIILVIFYRRYLGLRKLGKIQRFGWQKFLIIALLSIIFLFYPVIYVLVRLLMVDSKDESKTFWKIINSSLIQYEKDHKDDK